MRLNEIFEEELAKAGFLPYTFEEDGELLFLFMIPSDSKYGGPQPGIAKGEIDRGETTREAAEREAKEELGLKMSNIKPETIKLAWKGSIEGNYESYMMTVYVGEVKNKDDFGKPHFETGSTHWLSAKEFRKEGRASQVHIVNAATRVIANQST